MIKIINLECILKASFCEINQNTHSFRQSKVQIVAVRASMLFKILLRDLSSSVIKVSLSFLKDCKNDHSPMKLFSRKDVQHKVYRITKLIEYMNTFRRDNS